MNSKAVWFIIATMVLDAVGVGLIFPIMPDLMARVGADSTANGALLGGILMAAYAAMLFVCSPAMGALSDAYGRRPVLILSLGILVADYIIMALSTSYWMLLVGRLLAGAAGATLIPATAYLADISPPEKRAASFGLIGAAYGIGFVMGPALGGVAATWHITAPFWLAAGFAAVNMLFGLMFLPESLSVEHRKPVTLRALNPFTAILDAFRLPGLAVPLLILFVFEFANMAYPTLWAYWLKEMFGWSAALIGASLTAYGIGIAVSQGVLLRVLAPRLGDFRTLVLSMAFAILALVGFGIAGKGWLVFALIPVAAVADMAPPIFAGLMSNRISKDRQGMLQGVITSMSSVSAMVAPLLFTWAFQVFARPDGPAPYFPGAPFLLAALLVALTLPFLKVLTTSPKNR
ncbi:MAG TPA: MFS transporter [Aliiroseovarius sp.]|nr:MFS transporter [Aliiroseovarius sp.]